MLLQFIGALSGLFFVVFLPGYLATWVVFPKTKCMKIETRIVITPILSILLILSSVILMRVFFGIYSSNVEDSIVIIIFPSAICLLIAVFRHKEDSS
jgi:uncharacterized membrane protein